MRRSDLEHLIRAAAYGYYAQGVSENMALLLDGWKERLIVVQK
jgi:hypothetical protein